MNEENFDILYKIVIIGDSGVGKSNILSRYVRDEFSIDTKATVGVEFGSKILTLNNQQIKIQIWDTAGQEKYKSVSSIYYKGAKGALLVYDISRKETFNNINRWINEIKNNSDENINILLIGNKCDLEEARQISQEEAFQKAKEINAGFLEVSALQAVNIEKAFMYLIQQIHSKNYNKLDERKNTLKENNNDYIIINSGVENSDDEKNEISVFQCTFRMQHRWRIQ